MNGHLLYEPIHAVLRENRYPKISLILIFPIRHLPVWGIMWVKQCHKPSPSHHHQLICIYIYNVVYTTHSQSWLVKMALFYQPSPHQTGRPSGMLGFSTPCGANSHLQPASPTAATHAACRWAKFLALLQSAFSLPVTRKAPAPNISTKYLWPSMAR